MEIVKKMSLPIFLGNHKAEKYLNMAADLVQSYKAIGCNVSLKVHFLDSHLEFLTENLRAVKNVHG